MSHPSERAVNIRNHHIKVAEELEKQVALHQIVVFTQDCIIEGVDAAETAEALREAGITGTSTEAPAATPLPHTADLLDDLLTVDELDEEFGENTDYPHSANKDEKIAYVISLYTDADSNGD